MSVKNLHPILWIAAVTLLLVALLPLPYGYYVFLRLAICAGALLLAVAEYHDHGVSIWTLVLGVLVLLFNPVIPVYLTRDIWVPIDAGAAVLIGAHYWHRRHGATRDPKSQ